MSDSGQRELVAALNTAFGDRYRLAERLGAGAHGAVFRAKDTRLGRDVAIKHVRFDLFPNPAHADEMKRRTEREARMAARLRHPNIITVHDILHTETSTLLIMEYVDGRTLEALLAERERLGLEETLALVSQAADALDHAHEQGVVHRDIKPANIMIDENGTVKIADFGIAKSQGSDVTANITATGNILGTPYYMSPEQARGEAGLDGRSDLFSLASLTYECLSGRRAFAGKAVVDVLLQIVNGEPCPLDCEALGLDARIEGVLGRALEKRADHRYQTAAELIEALHSVPAVEAAEQVPVVTSRAPGRDASFDTDFQGSLSERGLADLLHDIQTESRTGILHLQRDGLTKRLYFLQGGIAFANSDIDSDRLGEFLIAGGVIDRSSYERAARAMRGTRRRLGKTLVDLGELDEQKLDALISEQIRQIIYSVFSWESGHYAFETIAPPVEEDIVVTLPTDAIILEGVRSLASDTTVRKAVGSLEQVPRHPSSTKLDAGQLTLTSSEGFVLSRVDGSTSIADLVAISPLGELETLRCIYGFVSAGILELAGPREPGTAGPESPPFSAQL